MLVASGDRAPLDQSLEDIWLYVVSAAGLHVVLLLEAFQVVEATGHGLENWGPRIP